MDSFQIFGEDLKFSENNDVLKVFHPEEGTQRLLRRLLTPKGSYIWHPDYGSGLPAYIGETITEELLEKLNADIKAQIFQESFVAKNPQPTINIEVFYDYIECMIKYFDTELEKYQQLSFTVTK